LLQSPYDLDDLRAATGGQRAGAPRPAAGIEQVCAGGQRLFRQIERILQINALRLITNEVVEAARENRVVGLH